jgi:hypothetical protein
MVVPALFTTSRGESDFGRDDQIGRFAPKPQLRTVKNIVNCPDETTQDIVLEKPVVEYADIDGRRRRSCGAKYKRRTISAMVQRKKKG